MAITNISVPSAQKPVAEPEKESWHDKLLKGLQIAGAAFQIPVDIQSIRSSQAQIELVEAKKAEVEQRTLNAPQEFAEQSQIRQSQLEQTQAGTAQKQAATEKLKAETSGIEKLPEKERIQTIERLDKRVEGFIQRSDVKGTIDNLSQINTIEALLSLETPQADMQAVTQGVRALAGESGVLTDKDIERNLGNIGLETKLKTAVRNWITGEGALSPDQRAQLAETIKLARSRIQFRANALEENAAKNFKSFERALDDFDQQDIRDRLSISNQVIPVELMKQEAQRIIDERLQQRPGGDVGEAVRRGGQVIGQTISGAETAAVSGIKEAAQGAAIAQRELFNEVVDEAKSLGQPFINKLQSLFQSQENNQLSPNQVRSFGPANQTPRSQPAPRSLREIAKPGGKAVIKKNRGLRSSIERN